MRGVYWLIIGLSIWFVPYIIINIISSGTRAETIPIEAIIVQFAIALAVMIKAVLTIRKERKIKQSSKK